MNSSSPRSLPAAVAPMTVHLVRHGEIQLEGGLERVYGDLEMPLSERGIAQLEATAKTLSAEPLSAVYASDLERARIGAEAIARPHGLAVRVDSRLREIYRGEWRGLTWEEIDERWPGGPARFLADPGGYRGHEGETVADVDRRAAEAFERIVAERAGESVAVVSHSWVIRALLARALGMPLEGVIRLDAECGAIATIAGDARGWRVKTLNLR
jgi:broad specificity phosphatase PhoE